jgi:hypothetical protein
MKSGAQGYTHVVLSETSKISRSRSFSRFIVKPSEPSFDIFGATHITSKPALGIETAVNITGKDDGVDAPESMQSSQRAIS